MKLVRNASLFYNFEFNITYYSEKMIVKAI